MTRQGSFLPRLINVIDVESTCWPDQPPPGQKSEIIEIGVVVLDAASGELLEKHDVLLRPAQSEVSALCTEITGLVEADLADGISFAEACQWLRKACSSRERLWASYGDYDRVQFQRNCEDFAVGTPFGRRHLNVKTLFGLSRSPVGEVDLDAAVAAAGLEWEGRHHRAHDDAWNTAKLLWELLRRMRG